MLLGCLAHLSMANTLKARLRCSQAVPTSGAAGEAWRDVGGHFKSCLEEHSRKHKETQGETTGLNKMQQSTREALCPPRRNGGAHAEKLTSTAPAQTPYCNVQSHKSTDRKLKPILKAQRPARLQTSWGACETLQEAAAMLVSWELAKLVQRTTGLVQRVHNAAGLTLGLLLVCALALFSEEQAKTLGLSMEESATGRERWPTRPVLCIHVDHRQLLTADCATFLRVLQDLRSR